MNGQIDAVGYAALYLENMTFHLTVEVLPYI